MIAIQLFDFDAFNKININFGETFSELFGGGKASLVLSDELDVLESDIEINGRHLILQKAFFYEILPCK